MLGSSELYLYHVDVQVPDVTGYGQQRCESACNWSSQISILCKEIHSVSEEQI